MPGNLAILFSPPSHQEHQGFHQGFLGVNLVSLVTWWFIFFFCNPGPGEGEYLDEIALENVIFHVEQQFAQWAYGSYE
jgi:hypothetical protein